MKVHGKMVLGMEMVLFIMLMDQSKTSYFLIFNRYEGEWKNNCKDGYAIFTEDTGNII